MTGLALPAEPRAAELFAAALAIRERIGAPADQIESSRDALAAAGHRMGEQ